MENWMSQLEMEWNDEDMLLNNLYMQYNEPQKSMDTFIEELASLLGEDFFPSPSIESNNIISKVPSNVSISSLPNDHVSPPSSSIIVVETPVGLPQEEDKLSDCRTIEDGIGKRKRKREPSQIYDHIMAERKRRELLAQLFIALSALLPGLKKVDKTSILGEAIKQMQQLTEKVKTLEEAAAKQNVESLVFVKRSKLVVANNEDSSCTIDNNNCASGCHSGGGSDGDDYTTDSLPEIEVKVSNKTILIRICCEKRKGVSAKIFAEVEKHDIVIRHSNIATFGISSFNVTIGGQTEKTEKKQMMNLVKSLHSIVRA